MKKLNDTQLILLSAAANRDNASLVPFPDTLTAPAERLTSAIATLLKAAYVEEGEVQDASVAWRQEGETNIGVRITDAGLAVIAVGDGSPKNQVVPLAESIVVLSDRKQTKTALVLDLLRRDEGATLAELAMAAGWLPHTTRAALTGLRKKHHKIKKGKRGEDTLYRIERAA